MQKCLQWTGAKPKRTAINAFLGEVGWDGYGLYKSKRRKAETVDLTGGTPTPAKKGTALGDRMKEASRIYKAAKAAGRPLTWTQAREQVFKGSGSKSAPAPAPREKEKQWNLTDEKEPDAYKKVQNRDIAAMRKRRGPGKKVAEIDLTEKSRPRPGDKRKASDVTDEMRVWGDSQPAPAKRSRPADKGRASNLPDEVHKGKEKVRQLTVGGSKDDYEFQPHAKGSPFLGIGLNKGKKSLSTTSETVDKNAPEFLYVQALHGYRPSGIQVKTKKEKATAERVIREFESKNPAKAKEIKSNLPRPYVLKTKGPAVRRR